MVISLSLGFASQLRIDLGAICTNYRTLAEAVFPAECGAVLKANAYGLGIGPVAQALHNQGCRIYFVAQLCEAPPLFERVGTSSTIFVLNGLNPGEEPICAQAGFVPVLNTLAQVKRWRECARRQGRILPAALQLDSGMSRLGLSSDEAQGLAEDASFTAAVSLRLIMTHLACADEPDHPANAEQLSRFLVLHKLFPNVPASIANSGGVFLSDQFHCELVRPGISLFGVPPGMHADRLQPAVSLYARVIQIREIDCGTRVGYGSEYIAPGKRRLATLGVGYADGWPRSTGGFGAAWFEGNRLPIVGRVSMDSMTVDISALPVDAIDDGDFVELIGPSQSLDRISRDAGTIPYELLTRLGTRHQRVYVDGNRTEIISPGPCR